MSKILDKLIMALGQVTTLCAIERLTDELDDSWREEPDIMEDDDWPTLVEAINQACRRIRGNE